MGKVVLILFLMGIGVVVLALLCSGGSASRPSGSDPLGTAEGACQVFVKRQLVAPSTAFFSETRSGKHPSCAQCYEVLGRVESKNAYGVPLQQRYLCIVEFLPQSDEWKLRSLDWLSP